MSNFIISTDKKILIVGALADSLWNFRGPLIRELAQRGHRVVTASAPSTSDAREAITKLGAELHEIPMARGGTNPVSDLCCLTALAVLMRHVRPEIVLSYTMKPVIYGSLAARLTGVPRIVALITGLGYLFDDERNADPKDRLARFVGRRLLRRGLAAAHAVILQNEDDLSDLRRSGLLTPAHAIHRIAGSGVDLERFAIAPFQENAPCEFLMIARLLRAKGVREYVEAARAVRSEYPETRFRLAGWIDRVPDAIAPGELEAWRSEGIIEYLGRLKDVRPAIANCGIYVLPSYREGTPRTVLEAMAMGRPVITTDAPGCRETVVEGVNGFLVPPRDPAALAAAMIRFIRQPELVVTMGRESRRIAEQIYDVRKVNQQVIHVLGL